jgi:hypothetical protein
VNLVYEGGKNGRGERDGEGMLYYVGDTGAVYPQKVLIYKGGWKGGVKSGEGELWGRGGGRLYEGGFVDGVYGGKGRLYCGEGGLGEGGDGRIYEGGFEKGRKCGGGKLFDGCGNLVYDGRFEDDKYHTGNKKGSEGMLYKTLKDKEIVLSYFGFFKKDKMHGANGIMYNDNGTVYYQGEFSDGKFEGRGNLFYPSSDKDNLYVFFKIKNLDSTVLS